MKYLWNKLIKLLKLSLWIIVGFFAVGLLGSLIPTSKTSSNNGSIAQEKNTSIKVTKKEKDIVPGLTAEQTIIHRQHMKQLMAEHEKELQHKKEQKVSPKYILDTSSEVYSTMEDFLSSWKDRNFKRMVKYTQQRWQDTNHTPIKTLSNLFSDYTLKSSKIIKVVKKTPVYSVVYVDIQYTAPFSKGLTKGKIVANVIKDGIWFGVNPYSAMVK